MSSQDRILAAFRTASPVLDSAWRKAAEMGAEWTFEQGLEAVAAHLLALVEFGKNDEASAILVVVEEVFAEGPEELRALLALHLLSPLQEGGAEDDKGGRRVETMLGPRTRDIYFSLHPSARA
jgi:hypothetical protein